VMEVTREGPGRNGESLGRRASGVALSLGGNPVTVNDWNITGTSVGISARWGPTLYHFEGTPAGNIIRGTFYGDVSSGTWSVTRQTAALPPPPEAGGPGS